MLTPWKKSYDKPTQHIRKQRYHFADKRAYSQSYAFSGSHVWMWDLDKKKAMCQRIDAFKLWCWRRLLIVPWTARKSNQSILKEINPEYSLEGLMPKLKLQYFGHLMQTANSLEKTLMLERLRAAGGGGDRGWDSWIASWTQWTWVWANSRRQWRTGKPGRLQSVGSQGVRCDLATKQRKQQEAVRIPQIT